MKKVWVRLGGYVNLTDEEIELIKKDDGSTSNIFDNAVKERGFLADGDSYVPADSFSEEGFNEEVSFDIGAFNLVVGEMDNGEGDPVDRYHLARQQMDQLRKKMNEIREQYVKDNMPDLEYLQKMNLDELKEECKRIGIKFGNNKRRVGSTISEMNYRIRIIHKHFAEEARSKFFDLYDNKYTRDDEEVEEDCD